MTTLKLGQICLLVFIIGALLRLGIVISTMWASGGDSQLPDEVQYWDMARSLAGGQGLRDELGFAATRMPVYPAYLALFVNLPQGRLYALLVQALISAASCGFIAWLGFQITQVECQPEEVRFPAFFAIVAGLLVAVDPFLVYFSRFLLTENMFICAFCAFMAVGWRTSQRDVCTGLWRWLGTGLLFGLCVYLRPSSVMYLVCWSAFLLTRRRFDRVGVVGVSCMWLVLGLLLCPWAARNKAVTGSWTWLTHRGGISLYDGVRPQATGASDLGAIKRMEPVGQLNEVEWDEYFRRESWECIRSEPYRLLRLAGVKFTRTWSLWPNAPGYQSPWIRIVGGSWTLLMLGTAVVGIFINRRDWATCFGLLLPVFYFTALHMIFVGSVRYRLPAMPMMEVLSAIGLIFILSRIRGNTLFS